MAQSNTERTQAFRNARQKGDEVQVNLWLPRAEAERLNAMVARECSTKKAVVVRLIREAKP